MVTWNKLFAREVRLRESMKRILAALWAHPHGAAPAVAACRLSLNDVIVGIEAGGWRWRGWWLVGRPASWYLLNVGCVRRALHQMVLARLPRARSIAPVEAFAFLARANKERRQRTQCCVRAAVKSSWSWRCACLLRRILAAKHWVACKPWDASIGQCGLRH